ncbi:hypothetical protein AVEN_145797-1, partial [Araneus ventricosus]
MVAVENIARLSLKDYFLRNEQILSL